MIADARQFMHQAPWGVILPMSAIFVTVLGFNLLGDGLRRALDPRLLIARQVSASSVLSAENLTVSLGAGRNETQVLRDLTFAVGRGRVLGLVGESGAGKSMVGRVIAGNLPGGFAVTGGGVTFAGRNLVTIGAEERRTLLGDRIAFIPQEPLSALNPLMTVGAQFGEHLGRLGIPREQRRGRIVEALRSVRLQKPETLLERYSFQLSGGMCQRVLIAMAFASKPALIVADEPTTALDVSTQVSIVQLIRVLQVDHGTALVFITHDLKLAARVCDEIVVLYAGEMVERGPARNVMEAPRHPYTRSSKLRTRHSPARCAALHRSRIRCPGSAPFAI